MRIAKTESLKKDIEIISQNHERDVDRKDAILQMIDRDLEEAEDQYQMSLRSNLMNIDQLISSTTRGCTHSRGASRTNWPHNRRILTRRR